MDRASLSRTSSSLPLQTGDTNAPKVDQTSKPKLESEARASQSQLLQNIVLRPLKQRAITVDNLISKDGFKMALGKASRHAKVKDAMMRTAFKLTTLKKADPAFGSLHKASLRLADQYHGMVEIGAPESQRLAVLRDLRQTLKNMDEKHVGTQLLKGKTMEQATDNPIRDMLKFVEHEIARQPSEHLRVANQMMETGYSKLKEEGASISKKTTFLNIAREHLLAAEDSVPLDKQAKALLKTIETEIDQLEQHEPLKNELEEFVKNKDKNLKHVHTRVVDPVADMHSKRIQREVIEGIEDEHDIGAVFDHLMVGLDIRTFDKGLLRQVETNERTGLEQAKMEFQLKSLDDSIVSILAEDHTRTAGPIVRDPQLTDLTATSLNSDTFANMGEALAQAIKTGDKQAITTLATDLGQLLGTDVRQCSKDVQLGFVTSRGEDLKNDLLHLLARPTASKQLPELAGSYSQASDTVRGFLDQAYNVALNQLENRLEGDTLHLDGLEFTKSKQIGAGGFGTVSIYKAIDDNGKEHSIVVKEPIIGKFGDPVENHVAAFDNAANESRSHRAASEGNSPHIVPFRGAVQTPDGRLLIAMDLAEHGDVGAFADNLTNAVKNNTIPPQVANLVRITLLKDMAGGLQHLQDRRGITHIDIKPQNFFINGDGVTQLGDFGLADTTLEREFDHRPLDAAFNTSPEIAAGSEDLFKFRSDITEGIKKLKATIKNEVPKLPASEQAAERDRLNKQIAQLRKIGQEQSFTVNEKADTFSLGMAAYGLFRGQLFIDSLIDTTFESKRIDALVDYGASDLSGKLSGTGVGALDRVLNAMLDPDPESRLGMTDLLQLSLFSEPGVGCDEVRALIKLIADPTTDPAKLKEACDKLGV